MEKENDKAQKEDKVKEEKEIKKVGEDEVLFTCISKIDVYEYKKMTKYFPQIYWAFVTYGTIANLLVNAVLAILWDGYGALFTFVIVELLFLIYYKIRLGHVAEKYFKRALKKGYVDSEIHSEFYKDYFIRQGESVTYKIKYTEIDKCIETDANFYLENKKLNKIITLQKNECSLELILFLRKQFNTLESHLGENSIYRDNGEKKGVPKNSKLIRNGMLILFVVTLLSLEGGFYTMQLIDKINPSYGFGILKNMWAFGLWLPIPILSIILGFKYKKQGYKCTKNIVAGFIVGFYLIIATLPAFIDSGFSVDYDLINDYKDIISVELPKNGELESIDWDTFMDEDKTDYSTITAYYSSEAVSQLVSNIKKSNNWIRGDELKSELKILLPSTLSVRDNYISIYNKTLNQYNTLPSEEGEYEIYAMKYNVSEKILEIHKFMLTYK